MTRYPSAAQVFSRPVDLALKLGTQAEYECVAHEPDSYIKRTPKYKIVKKFLHKFLYMLVNRQLDLFREKLDIQSRVLFLYTGKDSFGDANMELSGRALLKERDVRIDLFTLPKLYPQFKEDDIFENVYTHIQEIDVESYDAILLAEFNHRSLRLKYRYFARTPFACLFGYFDGPDRNQVCFSHAAFNKIFSLGMNDADLLKVAKPYLHGSLETAHSIEGSVPTQDFLTLSIGGVDPYRTYQYWADFLHLLDAKASLLGIKNVVLVGSDNGRSTAIELIAEEFDQLQLSSQVGQMSLLQTRALIARAKIFVGCDGGLMHIAHSTSTPTVALFSNAEPAELRITIACRCQALQSTGNVSKIPPNRILGAVESAFEIASDRF